MLQFGKDLVHDGLISGEARLQEIIIGPVHGSTLREGIKLLLSQSASLHFLGAVEHIWRHLVGGKIIVRFRAGTSIDKMHILVVVLLLDMLDLRETKAIGQPRLGGTLLHHVQVFRR